MALVIVSGLACSGRSTRSNQLASYFQDQINNNSSDSTSSTSSTWLPSKVVIVSDSTVHSSKSIYSNQLKEKPARASYLSAVVRSLDPQSIVIADGGAGTNIKGFRYQLWCAARELRVRCLSIHVHAPPEKCRQWNQARRERGEESYDPDTLDWLLQRFEEPTDMVRWDSPLFVLPSIDETEIANSNQVQTNSSTSKLTLEALEQVHQSTKIDSQDQQLEETDSNGLKEDTKKAIEKLLKSEEENRASKKKVSSSFQKRPIKKKVVAVPPKEQEEEFGSKTESMQEDLKRLDLKDEDFPSPPPSISPSSSSIGGRSNTSSNPNKSSLRNQISPETQDSTNPTFKEIWKIATSGKVKKPPNVVVVSKVTSSNYLSILENSTSKLISSLLDYQNSFGLPIGGGGLISLNIYDDDGGNHKIDLNLPNNNDKILTFTTLTKLRRSFVRVHSIGGSAGGEVMTKVGDDLGDSSVKKGDLLNDENESSRRGRNGDGKRNKGKDEGKEESLEIKVARKFAIWLEQSL